jgi:hypothetical protein
MNKEIGYLIQLLDKRVRECVDDFLKEVDENGATYSEDSPFPLNASIEMQSFNQIHITLSRIIMIGGDAPSENPE